MYSEVHASKRIGELTTTTITTTTTAAAAAYQWDMCMWSDWSLHLKSFFVT
jgi:hypothetical protein